MTNSDFRQLINKYAILVFIGYFASFALANIIQRFIPKTNAEDYNIIGLLSTFAWVIQMIINIIAATLISKDLKKLDIKNRLIIMITVLFSLIGITMFFITINREIKKAST